MEENISLEDLKAAEAILDALQNGTHYQKQEQSGFVIKYIG